MNLEHRALIIERESSPRLCQQEASEINCARNLPFRHGASKRHCDKRATVDASCNERLLMSEKISVDIAKMQNVQQQGFPRGHPP
jgi:hypothetical protein